MAICVYAHTTRMHMRIHRFQTILLFPMRLYQTPLSRATYSGFREGIKGQVGVRGHPALGCLQTGLWTLGIEHSTFQLGFKHPMDYCSALYWPPKLTRRTQAYER